MAFTRFFCLLLLLTTAASASTFTTHSVLRASQLAIGEWDIFLKCSRDVYETILFPQVKTHTPANLLPRLSWEFPFLPSASSEYPCRLSMFSNGTFRLEPSVPTHEPSSSTHTSGSSQNTPLLSSIHGKWKTLPNPYCATDRYYDELILCSNRRVERALPRRTLPWTKTTSHNMLQRIQFRLTCRMYGQYWSSDGDFAFHVFGRRNANVKGRLSHGVLVTDRLEGSPASTTRGRGRDWWRRHVVSASFVGFRRQPLVPEEFVQDDVPLPMTARFK